VAREDTLTWHDVHCRVTGPAAADLYRTCLERIIDNQLLSLKKPESFPIPAQTPGSMAVQICRTYRAIQPPPIPYSFAPLGENGVFQLILNAIARTRKFIYLEDQFFICVDDRLMAALTKCLKQDSFDAMIILTSRGDSSVQDTLLGQSHARRKEVLDILRAAAPKKVILCQPKKYYCHAKIWVFDDLFAIIGSANFNRRGYFGDSEVVAGIADPKHVGERFRFAHRLRMDLWKKHLGAADREEFLEVDAKTIARWRSPALAAEPFEPDPKLDKVKSDTPFNKLAADQAWDEIIDPAG
jgi:phosphatidylserine/phosphatidylglycerophosphate/cardiolipin synthase-like enzyme